MEYVDVLVTRTSSEIKLVRVVLREARIKERNGDDVMRWIFHFCGILPSKSINLVNHEKIADKPKLGDIVQNI